MPSYREIKHPNEVATRETLDFVQSHLGGAVLRILEVGCGNGALAEALLKAGHTVIALDADAEAVARARRRSVDARQATWPNVEETSFDAVLFTRSLHHIHPLDAALDKAWQVLRPGGVLLVEDFAYQDVDAFTASWFYNLLALLNACGVLVLDEDGFGYTILAGDGTLASWQHEHAHDLHTAGAMEQAIRRRFRGLRVARAPYLYRYVSSMVAETEAGAALVARVLALEKSLGEARRRSLIGRRSVAWKETEE